jgi:hypothetical protein
VYYFSSKGIAMRHYIIGVFLAFLSSCANVDNSHLLYNYSPQLGQHPSFIQGSVIPATGFLKPDTHVYINKIDGRLVKGDKEFELVTPEQHTIEVALGYTPYNDFAASSFQLLFAPNERYVVRARKSSSCWLCPEKVFLWVENEAGRTVLAPRAILYTPKVDDTLYFDCQGVYNRDECEYQNAKRASEEREQQFIQKNTPNTQQFEQDVKQLRFEMQGLGK